MPGEMNTWLIASGVEEGGLPLLFFDDVVNMLASFSFVDHALMVAQIITVCDCNLNFHPIYLHGVCLCFTFGCCSVSFASNMASICIPWLQYPPFIYQPVHQYNKSNTDTACSNVEETHFIYTKMEISDQDAGSLASLFVAGCLLLVRLLLYPIQLWTL